MILLNQEMRFKKNLIEKNYFFLVEKKMKKNVEKMSKISKFREKNLHFFSKLFFDQKKIIFFDRIFLKVHLLIQENRFEVVSERFRQFRAKKNQGKKVLSGK